jgi:hypothetical protein
MGLRMHGKRGPPGPKVLDQTATPTNVWYSAYNNFADYHTLTDVSPRARKSIKGSERLKSVGDRIVTPAPSPKHP